MAKLGEAKPGQNLILEDRGLIHPVPVFCFVQFVCLFFREPDQDSMDSERREDGFVLRKEVGGEFGD
jgi:hypothetical protein